MSPDPVDSENAMSKKPRLRDSSDEERGSAMEVCGARVAGEATENKGNGFEELGLLDKPESGFLGRTVSHESDGKLEGCVGSEAIGAAEADKEKQELGFDLNFPAEEGDLTFIDWGDENECEGKSTVLCFGYGGNGDLGDDGLESVKGETIDEGVKKRRSSIREDKGKEKVDDGDWLQLWTGSNRRPRAAASAHNSDEKRCDSLSFGLK